MQLLAGVGPHEGEEGAQVGQLLPAVTGHLAQQRALAVDDLVVADRQDEVLAPGVHQRERHLVVVVLPVDRLVGDVGQRVVHPAHVPLQPEAQAAQVRRPGDARPGRGLLGDRDDAGHALVDRRVGLLQQLHGLEVLAAAVLVGHPLAVLARVVEVEHRGDGVDPQAVDVELLAASRARWRRGSCAPAGGRSRRRGCPSRAGRRAAGRGARRAAGRRSGRGRRRPWGSAPAPSRGSRRSRAGATCPRGSGSRRGSRTGRSGRSSR